MSVLADLLAATPVPPTGDALLPAFAIMHAARQVILDQLTAPVALVSEDEHAQVALLRARETAWADAIAAAISEVRNHRLNARKLRGYRVVLLAGGASTSG